MECRGSEIHRLAKAILKLPSDSRIGDGVRAAAALAINDDIENAYETKEVLWEMAARAGFTPPASIAKRLKRMADAYARKADAAFAREAVQS